MISQPGLKRDKDSHLLSVAEGFTEQVAAWEGFTELVTALAKMMRLSGLGTLGKIVTRSVKPTFTIKPTIEDCVLHTTWNEHSHLLRVFVRFSGEPEYQVSDTTNLFINAIIQEDPISEEEYYAF